MKRLKYLALPLALGSYTIAAEEMVMPADISWKTPASFLCDTVDERSHKAEELNNAGVTLSKEGDMDGAITEFIKSITSDTTYSDPWNNAAVAYWKKGEHENALLALSSALKLDSQYPEALHNLGSLMLQKQDFDTAEKYLKSTVQIRPDYEKAYLNLIRLYLTIGNEEKAWQCQKTAAERNPENEGMHSILGQLSLRLKKYPDAVKALERAIELGDKREETQSHLAYAYFMNGQVDKALELYEKLGIEAGQKPEDVRSLITKKDKGPSLGSINSVEYQAVADCLSELQKELV